MKKKTNFVKRNSGFIIGCVLAGGASFTTSNVLMSGMLPGPGQGSIIEEVQSEDIATGTIEPENPARSVFETDPFTVTAAGAVVNGVESEPAQPETVQPPAESESAAEDSYIEGDSGYTGEGSDGGSDSSGQWEDDGSGQWEDDGSGYYEQPIEIYDSGNGDYSYDDSGSGWDDGSGGGDWSGDDGSGGDWSGDDGSGGDWSGDDGSGGDWSGDGGSGGDWGGDDGSGGDWSEGDGTGGGDDSAWTPSEVIVQGISSRYIDVSELYNYDLGQLRLIRNEIFALHGRIFNSQDLMDYFSQRSWYVPTYAPEDFDANMFEYLNDYEQANLQVIMDYEAQLGGY